MKNTFTINHFILTIGLLSLSQNVLSEVSSGATIYKPIILWHGMGDTAINVKFALRFLEEKLPGVQIESLQLGSNPAVDMKNSYFWNVNEQIKFVCTKLKSMTHLKNGYNAIGLSQGGQFLRGLVERCSDGPPMLNLISLGGQHEGVFGLPRCSAPDSTWCEEIDRLITKGAYESWIQNRLVQAEYWHDPFMESDYVAKSIFIADINNERGINEKYRENLKKLANLVLVKFNNDSIVQPRESEWFGYFKSGQDKDMYTLQNSPIYIEDRIGLRALDESGRLHLISVDGDHLEFTQEWFIQNIMNPFLSN